MSMPAALESEEGGARTSLNARLAPVQLTRARRGGVIGAGILSSFSGLGAHYRPGRPDASSLVVLFWLRVSRSVC